MSGLIRVVIVGGGGVGKSALTIQFLRGEFVEDYDPTIEESYRKDLVIENRPCTVEIQDTAGQEEYGSIRDKYLRSGEGFLLIYSIVSQHTLGEVKSFAERIRRAKNSDNIPMVIAGNKCDLEDQRGVPTSDGEDLAKKLNCLFYETSAKTRKNVDEVFNQVVREIFRTRKFKGDKKEKKEKDKKKTSRVKKNDSDPCTLL